MLTFIDVKFSERKGSCGATSVKIACDDGAPLGQAVKLAIKKFIQHHDDDGDEQEGNIDTAAENAFD